MAVARSMFAAGLAFLALCGAAPSIAAQQVFAPPIETVAEAKKVRASLQHRLEALSQAAEGRVGIAVIDPFDQTVLSVHGEEEFPEASTVKLAVAGHYLSEVRAGRRSLDRMISLDERMRVGSDGIAMLMPRPGVSLSAANLIELMLRVSDNTASDMLIADLGGTRAVQAWLDRNHVSGVRIDRTIARLVLDNLGLPILPGKTAAETLWASDEPSDEVQAKVAAGFDADPRDNATPIGMARFLARLDRDLLGPKEREFMLDVMSRCETGKDRLRALLPEGTRVEHKTGTLTGVSDDVGIIRLAGGRPLIVTVFTKGIADGKARAKIIAEVGKAAFDAYQPIALRGR